MQPFYNLFVKLLNTSFFFFVFIFSYGQNNGMIFNPHEKNYILTPSSSSLYPVNNFTIEFWIKANRQTTWDLSILNKAECVTNKSSFTISYRSTNQVDFGFNCTGNCNNTVLYTCNKILDLGKCYHVAYTYSSQGPKIYIDGVLQTGTYTLGTGYCGDLFLTPEPLRIGVYRFKADTLGGYFDGMLDEIRIWNHVRTSNQILENYQTHLTGNETGLLLYYNFNETISGNGQTVLNNASFSGAALNGTTNSINSLSPYTNNSCFNYSEIDVTNINYPYQIYPNPAENVIIINNESSPSYPVDIEITDITGRIITKTSNNALPININIEPFVKGFYYIKITEKHKTLLSTFIKK